MNIMWLFACWKNNDHPEEHCGGKQRYLGKKAQKVPMFDVGEDLQSEGKKPVYKGSL